MVVEICALVRIGLGCWRSRYSNGESVMDDLLENGFV